MSQFEFGRLPLSLIPVSGTGLSLLAFCPAQVYLHSGGAKELKQTAPSLAQKTGYTRSFISNHDIIKVLI